MTNQKILNNYLDCVFVCGTGGIGPSFTVELVELVPVSQVVDDRSWCWFGVVWLVVGWTVTPPCLILALPWQHECLARTAKAYAVWILCLAPVLCGRGILPLGDVSLAEITQE